MEIKQQLTLERQAFDAQMRINNTTDAGTIENVAITVKVTDESGTPVTITSDPDNTTSGAKFYIRVSSKQNITAIDGSGTVSPQTTSTVDWLLIPAPGSAGDNPLGKKYLVGATLSYRFNNQDTQLNVSPDVITVKPLPLLTLDYFLPTDVYADDPLTPEVEAIEPFSLGVRVHNTGLATAHALKIDSAQPKIVENKQGLLIGFKLDGASVDDTPVQPTLLLDFGDVAAATNRIGRWQMETTLSGKFSDFTARFTHADELGGTLTSLLQATNAHVLLHDVRVDLPGRDAVRDFLAQDGDVIRVYESDPVDDSLGLVTDRSPLAQFGATAVNGSTATYSLNFPPTVGFVFVKLPDPFVGTKVPGRVLRSDGKVLHADNVWLSKSRNEQTKLWTYFVNFFDVKTTGVYSADFQPPAVGVRPPVIQFIADHQVIEGRQVAFIVEASSPDGRPVGWSAAPLPTGAKFTPQAADPASPNLSRAVFDWTPTAGQAGSYLVTWTANDGLLSATRSATISVSVNGFPNGPGAPTIASPLSGAQVTALKPSLAAQASTVAHDPTTQLQFELYADAGLSQLINSAVIPKAPDAAGNGAGSVPQPTSWAVPNPLNDNTAYWWRVRAFDGTAYSLWTAGSFFVNLYNDPPERFNLLLPVPGGEVAQTQPTLSWANAVDKDGDTVTYGVRIYTDIALTELVTSADGIAADVSGTTNWLVATPLAERRSFFWRVIATDALGAQTLSSARRFFVGVGNSAPTVPTVVSPVPGSQVASTQVDLTVANASDADGDLITLVFELDTRSSFNTGAKQTAQLIQSAGTSTAWHVAGLIENQRYFWRAKAQDGRAESAWAQGDFLVNQVNEAPGIPTVRNPGNGAWVSSLAPVLEVNPATDPEGDAISYEFQIATDSAFGQNLQTGTSNTTAWPVPALLSDKTTYSWRARAVDSQGAASVWSAATLIYLSTGTYQPPSIQLTSPAVPTQPAASTKAVRLSWSGTDLNIEPTVALYYATSRDRFSGTLIVDGLRQSAGTQSANFDWDTRALAPGTYYVYAQIYDSRSSAQAWAPGAVVVVSDSPSGSVVVSAGPNLQTSEAGAQASFKIRLGSAPSADVILPIASTMTGEGQAAPPSLNFTAQNWNVDQTVTVTGQADCIPDGNRQYQVIVGRAVSLDPQYMGLSAPPVALSNVESAGNSVVATASNNPNVRMCALAVKSQQLVSPGIWEYQIDASFGNSGAVAVNGGTARLTAVLPILTIVNGEIGFGALQAGESGRSVNAIVLRSKGILSPAFFQAAVGFKWVFSVR